MIFASWNAKVERKEEVFCTSQTHVMKASGVGSKHLILPTPLHTIQSLWSEQ